MSDPTSDTMADRLEQKLSEVILARPEWSPEEVKVLYQGEPSLIPVQFHPFGVIFLATEGEAVGEEGYNADTGPVIYLRYDGYVSIEVLVPDVSAIPPGPTRIVRVPSYESAKRKIQAAKQAIRTWGGITRDFMPDPITSADGKEVTSQLILDATRNALQTRSDNDNVTNVGTFEFHIFCRREEFGL